MQKKAQEKFIKFKFSCMIVEMVQFQTLTSIPAEQPNKTDSNYVWCSRRLLRMRTPQSAVTIDSPLTKFFDLLWQKFSIPNFVERAALRSKICTEVCKTILKLLPSSWATDQPSQGRFFARGHRWRPLPISWQKRHFQSRQLHCSDFYRHKWTKVGKSRPLQSEHRAGAVIRATGQE